jgi:hypothetical protein
VFFVVNGIVDVFVSEVVIVLVSTADVEVTPITVVDSLSLVL